MTTTQPIDMNHLAKKIARIEADIVATKDELKAATDRSRCNRDFLNAELEGLYRELSRLEMIQCAELAKVETARTEKEAQAKMLFETCCSLCGCEIHAWQSAEANTHSNETARVHMDCAGAVDRLDPVKQSVAFARAMIASGIEPGRFEREHGGASPGACANRGGKR